MTNIIQQYTKVLKNNIINFLINNNVNNPKEISQILEYEQPNNYIVDNEKYIDKGTPVLTPGKTFILGYTNEKNNIYKTSEEHPIIIFDDFTTSFQFVDFDFKVKSSAMKILKPKENINLKYVFYAMKDIQYKPQEHKRQYLSIYSKFKINIPNCIDEQNNIVKKIEEIFFKIDIIEREWKNLENYRERFKFSILQQAIQGKLVEQREEEGTAKELLEQIRKEKDKLIKEGKVKINKKDKELKPIIEEEIPFEIPSNWEWVRMKNIVSITTGNKDANFGSEYGEYDFFTCALKPIKSKTYSFSGESIILPGNGANVGVSIYYNGNFEAYQRTYVIQGYGIYLKYLYWLLVGKWREYNQDKMFGSATPYIKLENLEKFPVPLPPLQEQKRIVKKIEEIFSKIDLFNKNIP